MISISFKNTYFLLVFLLFFSLISCGQSKTSKSNEILDENHVKTEKQITKEIQVGAQQTTLYLNILKQKK